MGSRVKKLASLAAAGAGAIVLTGGKAEAAIISSGTLNRSIAFTSDTPPSSFHVPTSVSFHTFANGPHFLAALFSLSFGSGTYNRFANFSAGGKSSMFANPYHPRVPAGMTWAGVSASATFARLADRRWGAVSSLRGLPAGTDLYELYRFKNGITTLYGWIQYTVSVTQANSSSHLDGPNITVVQYAWDDSGATIAAGALSNAPEPVPLAETGIGALVLGAVGLRRWRKARKAA